MLVLIIFFACGVEHPEMSEDAIGFEDSPSSDMDYYIEDHLSIKYNDRVYVLYGDIWEIPEYEKCIGYCIQEGIPDKNYRFYTIKKDKEENYLVLENVGGFMDPLFVFRAADTKGKDIEEYVEVEQPDEYFD